MEYNEIELTGYCGLYCGDCLRYHSRVCELAADLLAELDRTEFDKYAEIKSSPEKQPQPARELAYLPECRAALEAIAALQCNIPCRAGGGCPTFDCRILECCRGKDLEGCWQCGDLEKCPEFEALTPIHGGTPKNNLRIIRERGINGWSAHRDKCYVWQK